MEISKKFNGAGVLTYTVELPNGALTSFDVWSTDEADESMRDWYWRHFVHGTTTHGKADSQEAAHLDALGSALKALGVKE